MEIGRIAVTIYIIINKKVYSKIRYGCGKQRKSIQKWGKNKAEDQNIYAYFFPLFKIYSHDIYAF